MVKFNDLKIGSYFHVSMWEIQPFENNTELRRNYCLMMYQNGSKQSLLFIKNGIDTCYDEITKTTFKLENNKMISEKTGLYFFGIYVDNSLNTSFADKELVTKYFEEAEYYKNNKSIELVRK